MTALTRLLVTGGAFTSSTVGWSFGGLPGASAGFAIGMLVLVIPWRGQSLWQWAVRYLHRNRAVVLSEPVTVSNDRSAGGVRYQDGVVVSVVQILGRAHPPTLLAGTGGVRTSNTIDIQAVLPMLRQSLGLTVESASLITAGARRRSSGDYPRVYDTLIGTAPYAGQREAWLVLRIRDLENGDALAHRDSIGTAALAAAQRVAAGLRGQGVRARVASVADISGLETRLGRSALEPHRRRWHTLRGDGGWITTYVYRQPDVTAEALAAAWTLNVDGIIGNLTVFPDGTCCAAVTIRTSQPPTAPPSIMLRTLPGQQANALANNLCGPRRDVVGQVRTTLPASLHLPVGQSGVLLGKVDTSDRLLLPLSDPADASRIRIVADDAIVKRVVIRAAGAGERITVHTSDLDRWAGVRMPHVMVTDQARPAPGTTISVTDGTVSPAPRPSTVLDVAQSGTPARGPADVLLTQTGPQRMDACVVGVVYDVEVEFFRAENRYCAVDSPTRCLLSEPV